MAFVLAKIFGMSSLLAASLFFGNRLGTFLLLRLVFVPSKAEQMIATDKSPKLQRIPLAIAVALFYAFLMTPALYATRQCPLQSAKIRVRMRQIGTMLAWAGAIMEAIADGQKFIAKKRKLNNDEGNQDQVAFSGPTSGVYRISRHPNYTGELLYWLGMLIAGIPSFGSSVIGWVCSLLGFYGIFGIMTNATKRLDKKQHEVYGGQEAYDNWRAQVKAPIFPFVHIE